MIVILFLNNFKFILIWNTPKNWLFLNVNIYIKMHISYKLISWRKPIKCQWNKTPLTKGEKKEQDGWTQFQAKIRNHQLGWTTNGTWTNQIFKPPQSQPTYQVKRREKHLREHLAYKTSLTITMCFKIKVIYTHYNIIDTLRL